VRAFAMILVLALIAALAAGTSRVSGASASSLSVGDQLTYAVTVELQQHHVRGLGKNKDTVTESSAQGTITFTIYSIGRDGTAFTKADLNLSGNNAGQPVALQTATPAKVLPDGQLRTQAQVGLGVSDALAAANTTLAEIAQKLPLFVGKSWTTKAATPYVAFTMTRTVQDEAAYQGHRAYALQSVGQGSLLKTTDGKPASGTISVGGTTYFDSRNRLLIGETFRTLTVVQQPNSVAHDDLSAAFNIVLGGWTHASPQPQTSEEAMPAELPQETAAPEATPTPLPILYSTPYPTANPSSGP
jgi:hypothetical protein